MKVLLLAGTAQARELASRLAESGHNVLASLSGATRAPLSQSVKTRVGGFGGEAGFRRFLADMKPDLVVDATHPFAIRITERTARVCRDLSLPYLQLLRPAWVPKPGETWIEIPDAEASRAYVQPGSRVFLATGRQTLEQFAVLSDCYLICRQIDPPDRPFPFPNGEFLVSRPPFTIAEEMDLFRKLKIDWLIVKNAGGEASRPKIDAMMQLGGGVLVLKRPTQPTSEKVETVSEAMHWIKARADH